MKYLSYGILILAALALLLIGFFPPDQYPYPSCPFRSLTGWKCPGCGAQRALHHLLHGRWSEVWHLNMLLIPAMVYALLSVSLQWLFPSAWSTIRPVFFGRNAAWAALGIILLYAMLRNVIPSIP